MEEMTLYEQISLISKTSILISNHGAGLTNMIFMSEGIVIELKSDADNINNCFFNLADSLDLKYFYTLNKGDSKDVQKANIYADINKLDTLLRSIS